MTVRLRFYHFTLTFRPSLGPPARILRWRLRRSFSVSSAAFSAWPGSRPRSFAQDASGAFQVLDLGGSAASSFCCMVGGEFSRSIFSGENRNCLQPNWSAVMVFERGADFDCRHISLRPAQSSGQCHQRSRQAVETNERRAGTDSMKNPRLSVASSRKMRRSSGRGFEDTTVKPHSAREGCDGGRHPSSRLRALKGAEAGRDAYPPCVTEDLKKEMANAGNDVRVIQTARERPPPDVQVPVVLARTKRKPILLPFAWPIR